MKKRMYKYTSFEERGESKYQRYQGKNNPKRYFSRLNKMNDFFEKICYQNRHYRDRKLGLLTKLRKLPKFYNWPCVRVGCHWFWELSVSISPYLQVQ
jgi:hypothetical protein